MRWLSSDVHGDDLGEERDPLARASSNWWGRVLDRFRRPAHAHAHASGGQLVPSGRLAAISGVAVLAALVMLAIIGTPHQLVQDVFSRKTRGPALERPTLGSTPLVDQMQSVLADTEQVWSKLQGGGYETPKLVFFDNSTGELACGFPATAAGPFYCPADRRVYVDLSFMDDLQKRYGTQSPFALTYVIAHAVGHHIQNTAGVTGRIAAHRVNLDEIEGDQLEIRQELQADCLAGVWAHHSPLAQRSLAPGDIDGGLAATGTLGTEALRKRALGYVVPDDLSHGTSLQRSEWFRRGFSSGQVADCNAFEAQVL